MAPLTRRQMLAGAVPALGAGALLHGVIPHSHPWDHEAEAAMSHGAMHEGYAADTMRDGHAAFNGGRTVDHAANGFDPHELLRDFDWGTTPACWPGWR